MAQPVLPPHLWAVWSDTVALLPASGRVLTESLRQWRPAEGLLIADWSLWSPTLRSFVGGVLRDVGWIVVGVRQHPASVCLVPPPLEDLRARSASWPRGDSTPAPALGET